MKWKTPFLESLLSYLNIMKNVHLQYLLLGISNILFYDITESGAAFFSPDDETLNTFCSLDSECSVVYQFFVIHFA